jgi:hypothetical protein
VPDAAPAPQQRPEYAKTIKEVGEDPGVAGNETLAGIEAECRDLGLAAFIQRG